MRKFFFQSLYAQAIESAKAIAEPQETVNFLIRLLLPHALFSQKKESIDSHLSLIQSILSWKEISQSERDYLIRLLIVELLQIHHLDPSIFSDESTIDLLAMSIESEEERQEVLLRRIIASLPSSSDDLILDKIEEIEDLSSYEGAILSLLQERLTTCFDASDKLPPIIQNLLDRLQTEGSIACGWGKIAFASANQGNLPVMKKYLHQFHLHWEQIESQEIQDSLLSDLFSLGFLPFEQILQLNHKFHSIISQTKAWKNYAKTPDSAAEILPFFRVESFEKKIRQLEPTEQVRTYCHYAYTAYQGKQKLEARDSARKILSILPKITNQLEQVSLYRELIILLKKFSENQAALRVVSLCSKSLNNINTVDFREFQWRDTFFDWSLCFDSFNYQLIKEKYLTHLAIPEQRIQEITDLLIQTERIDDLSLTQKLTSLNDLSPFERTSRLIRLYRRGAGFALENKGSMGIMGTRIRELLFDQMQD